MEYKALPLESETGGNTIRGPGLWLGESNDWRTNMGWPRVVPADLYHPSPKLGETPSEVVG